MNDTDVTLVAASNTPPEAEVITVDTVTVTTPATTTEDEVDDPITKGVDATPPNGDTADATAVTTPTKKDDELDDPVANKGVSDSLEKLNSLGAMTESVPKDDNVPENNGPTTQDGELVTMMTGGESLTPGGSKKRSVQVVLDCDQAAGSKSPRNAEDVEMPVPDVPRRRGRPRKNILDPAPAKTPPVKRGPGRPRRKIPQKGGAGASFVRHTSQTECGRTSTVSTPKKKRGRPLKIPKVENMSSEEDNDESFTDADAEEEHVSSDDTDASPYKPSPKKRGRPRADSTPRRGPGKPRANNKAGRPRANSSTPRKPGWPKSNTPLSTKKRGRPRKDPNSPRKKWTRVNTDPFPSDDQDPLVQGTTPPTRIRTHNDFVTSE